MRQNETIKVEDISKHVDIPAEYLSIIRHFAKEFSYTSLISPVSSQDLIKAMLRAHASLNQRSELCRDDLKFVLMIKPYLEDPFCIFDGKIVKLRDEGLSYRQIEREIGKRNYIHQIQRVVKKAELRGILNSESPHEGCTNNIPKRQVYGKNG